MASSRTSPPFSDSQSLCDWAALRGRELANQLRPWAERDALWLDDPDRATAAVSDILQSTLDELAATGCWGEANRLASGCFWQESESILRCGSLQLHAREKPRGYAGDFAMLDRICRWDCQGQRLARAFDHFFQSQAAPQAVRNRTDIVAEAIVAEATLAEQPGVPAGPVVSIGSGPAADIQRAAERLGNSASDLPVKLLDLDPHALDFAERRLAGVVHLETIRENLFRLPKRAPDALFEPARLIVCTGLFDYLESDDAATLLRWCFDCLRPGGRLLVFNFAPHNPSRSYMEWIGNWYLVYRTKTEMDELARRAGLVEWRLDAEQQGIDLFLDVRKPG